ncbi:MULTISPECIES: hypothetical protein [Flavobacterium]|uniref:Uncharacterized protein n=1 Tax=Flavobacterium commune TaxID=1306519 RepID=A0A1D9P805_9FLAO|nr:MULTISPECIES: hypothetical protein [Flavobacterium]AOZ98710.1 hypothetical protein BIW12_04250 [Flavobacterium commune]
MKRIIIGFMICLLFWNCNKKKENKEVNILYIISEKDKKFLTHLQKQNIPPPLPEFYFHNQIIIDKNGDFYFYQKEAIPWHCIESETDTIPDFINLKPIEIIKIPNNSCVDFIKLNISNKAERQRQIIIASEKDTINNMNFNKILTFLNNSLSSKIDAFKIRRTTQEEDTVLKYKKNNEYYFSDSIKWDKTKIKFYK